MTLLTFSDCCDLLAVDPKTLQAYLKRVGMYLTPHPTDARIKCLTLAQVQHLAAVYGRVLPKLSAPALEEAVLSSAQQVLAGNIDSADAETDLHFRLAQVEGQLLALQQQLTSLTKGLLQRRELPGEHALAAPSPFSPSPAKLADRGAVRESTSEMMESLVPPSPRWTPHPAESRRSPVSPLIQYSPQGHYMIVYPQEGELSIVPDSSEWFAWLASLTSFHFVSKRGRFHAHREYDRGPKRSWLALRIVHRRRYKHYLGTTDHLTIACLEQMAARLQAEVETR